MSFPQAFSGNPDKKRIFIYWMPDQAGHDKRKMSLPNVYQRVSGSDIDKS
ncbi:MAG: hypothetical protein ACUZ8E_03375 [Candidatus Anammoxibacter sp.]